MKGLGQARDLLLLKSPVGPSTKHSTSGNTLVIKDLSSTDQGVYIAYTVDQSLVQGWKIKGSQPVKDTVSSQPHDTFFGSFSYLGNKLSFYHDFF